MTGSDTATRIHAAELLAAGRFAEGFALYEAWRESPAYAETAARQRLPLKRWRGEDLRGTRFLILSEEGFGDQIMYARFAKRLQSAGAEVVWYCPPALARLFAQCLGVTAVAAGASSNLGGFDFYCPSSSLAALFFPPLRTPPGEPYLRAPPAAAAPGSTIGVMTRGNPRHPNDARRSLPSEAAAVLLQAPGAIDLDPASTGARDFYDTACLLAGLDFVITVDTSVAHLAGAMGRSGWVLLPDIGVDWRWMETGDRSPWYPTLQLVRQRPGEPWLTVIERLKRELPQAGQGHEDPGVE